MLSPARRVVASVVVPGNPGENSTQLAAFSWTSDSNRVLGTIEIRDQECMKPPGPKHAECHMIFLSLKTTKETATPRQKCANPWHQPGFGDCSPPTWSAWQTLNLIFEGLLRSTTCLNEIYVCLLCEHAFMSLSRSMTPRSKADFGLQVDRCRTSALRSC